jgi:DNA-binding FadR family transcriptional regulator
MARLHREIMLVLTADIVTGARAPGDMLPREQDLAAEFGISRGVARECIRAMEERGLVSVKHGRGATVTPSTDWDFFDPDVLAAMLDRPDGGELLAEYLECRHILEVEAAGLAARRATKAELEQLASALDDRDDAAFRQALVAAAGNRALAALLETVGAGMTPPPKEADPAELRRILTAVAAGDAQAAKRAMAAHLATAAAELTARLRGRHRALSAMG